VTVASGAAGVSQLPPEDRSNIGEQSSCCSDATGQGLGETTSPLNSGPDSAMGAPCLLQVTKTSSNALMSGLAGRRASSGRIYAEGAPEWIDVRFYSW
jgi:hypothetical protein